MGKPDLLAKRLFATRTEESTHGAASWKEAPEIPLVHVQGDGMLVIRDAVRLCELAAPWCLVPEPVEILVEIKMQGDHVGLIAVGRTLLRRQALEVMRLEERTPGKEPWTGRQTIWLVSAYMPAWAAERYKIERLAPGCYRFLREDFTALWIASNELPLTDELIPFLVSRTGRALREFLDWLAEKKAWPLLTDLLRSLRMAPLDLVPDPHTRNHEDDDNLESLLVLYMNCYPAVKEEITRQSVEEAVKNAVAETKFTTALHEARDSVKRILRVRTLEVRPEDLARIESCTNIDTLHEWHDRAVTAASADELFVS